MLSLGTRRKHVFAAVVATVAILPTVVFGATKIISYTIAHALDYPMPAGFSDQKFYNAIVNEFKMEYPNEAVPDTGLTDVQLAKINQLIYSGVSGNKIQNVEGLEKLTGLTKLDLQWNEISAIDLSHNTLLTTLNLEKNSLTTIDLSALSQLTVATVSNNQLTSLDVTHNTNLKELYNKVNQLTSIDLSQNTLLEKVVLNENALESLSIPNRTYLKSVEATNNSIPSLDLSNAPALTLVDVAFNHISSINITNDTLLSQLKVASNQISSLNLSTNTALTYLDLDTNPISSIDLSSNTELKTFRSVADPFTNLDFSNNLALEYLYVPNNQLASIDLTANTNLKELEIYENRLTTLDLSHNTLLTAIKIRDNQLTSVELPENNTIKEIEAQRNNLSSLDVSNYTALTKLTANNNSLTTLDVSNNPALKTLEVNNNSLTTLDVSNNPALTTLKADNIPIKADVALSSVSGPAFSFANLKFLESRQSIANTDSYTYNSSSKVLTVSNASNVVNNAQVTSSIRGLSYKILLPVLLAFDNNGGSGAPDSALCYPSSGNNCTYEIPLGVPTRDGYEFLGWADSATATTIDYISGDTVTKSGYATLYATWSPIHTLSYNLNGGESAIVSQTCHSDVSTTAACTIIISDEDATRDGYVFLGWAETESATTASKQPGSSIDISADKTLYAVWSPIRTLSFNLNGGSSTISSQTCYPASDTTAACNVVIPNVGATKNDYVLIGWAESASATSAYKQPGDTVAISADKTLYAVWSPVYTLTFNLDGGAPAIDSRTCYPASSTTGSCYITIPNNVPVKQGYNFFGFASQSSARNPEYTAGDTYTFNNGDSRTKTLYAVWGSEDIDFDDGSEYVKGESEGLTITVDYPLSQLDKILIDGVEVPAGQYIVDEENGKITIKGTYLDTLSEGDHTLTLVFDDGSTITTTFSIKVNHDTDPEDLEPAAGVEPSENGDIILDITTPKVPVASVTINIYDEDGHLVKTVEISDPTNPARIDVSDLPNDDYTAEIIHKDADGNVLLVTTETFTKDSNTTVVELPIQTEVDVTEWIRIEIYDEDGNLVRVIMIDVTTGMVYVYDKDGNLIDTIENGYVDGKLVVPMDGLPSGNYDFMIYFLDKDRNQVGTLEMNNITYIADELPVPDTGRMTGSKDTTEDNGQMIIIAAGMAATVLAFGLYAAKRYYHRKNSLTF